MKQKKGFTIIELLTVMGVIAVLIGLLIPALGLVKDYSKRIQQKAQFHGIDVGLEIFKTEFGAYPESSDNFFTGKGLGAVYGGSNKLAEAMVGLDLLGFHPNADFRSDGSNDVILKNGLQGFVNVYDTTQGIGAPWQTGQENLNARRGPFLDLENANAFRMDEIYTNPLPFVNNFNDVGAGANSYPLALCDVYAKKRSGTNAKKTGTPILYYRAHNNYSEQDQLNDSDGAAAPPVGTIETDDDIYRYDDNKALIEMGMPDNTVKTPYALENALTALSGSAYEEFDLLIRNDQVQSVKRPYRADTYILISAGKDADFGTADDIFNFDKEIIE